MSIVVNDFSNFITIQLSELKQFNEKGISTELLNQLSDKRFNLGVKRKHYYIFNTNIAIQVTQYTKEFILFINLLSACLHRNIQMIMIKF